MQDRCLLSHSPSPQLCALRGGVWDDSLFLHFQHSGGRCLEQGEAEEYLRQSQGLEVLQVNVSNDGASKSSQWCKNISNVTYADGRVCGSVACAAAPTLCCHTRY